MARHARDVRAHESKRAPGGARSGPSATERLRLLEDFLRRTSAEDCARIGLAWLADCFGTLPTACVVCSMDARAVRVIATHGMPPTERDLLTAQLAPQLLASQPGTHFPFQAIEPPHAEAVAARPWRAGSAHAPGVNGANIFEAIPLPPPGQPVQQAWLLAPRTRRRRDLTWFTTVFGQALAPHLASLSGELRAGGGEVNQAADVTPRAASERPALLHDRREALDNAELYKQLKDASEELEHRIQAATADVAEQNELLRRQALELEQASAMKSQFLANMSHEFRTPLNAILGYTSMLLQGVAGPLEPAPRRHLTRIESNGRHLLAIINEILDISRIEAGRMPLQVTSIRLQDLLIEVRAELEPIIARTVVPVVLDIDRDLPVVENDRPKVKQILLNLLSNALKFTHAGAVTLRAQRSETEGAVAIAVTDTGIGIPAADQERIFDDFLQLDNSPTRPYGGTGLGLSICRRLAQMIGASLRVQSRVGHGSTFTLTLPIQGRK